MGSSLSSQVISSYSEKKQKLIEEIGAAKVVKATNDRLKSQIEELKSTVLAMEKASGILSKIGEDRQREAQDQIELLVTQGLQKIFGDHLSFKVVQSIKGKTPVVEFLIQTRLADGKIREADILSSMGGGVAAVTGFLLRLIVLLLDTSRKDAILILDETFAHVSDSYLPALSEFLREIVDKAKVQIVLVTHQPVFAEVADKAYKYSLDKNGYTVAKEM